MSTALSSEIAISAQEKAVCEAAGTRAEHSLRLSVSRHRVIWPASKAVTLGPVWRPRFAWRARSPLRGRGKKRGSLIARSHVRRRHPAGDLWPITRGRFRRR